MNCPHCGLPVDSEWEKCVICGTPIPKTPQTQNSLNPEEIAYWKIFYRPPWTTRWFQGHVTKNFRRAEARRRLFERLGYETRPVMPVYTKTNPLQTLQLIIIPELAKPENAKWLALLMDTEGAMGWRMKAEIHYGRTYIYRLPYLSIGMKEIESKRTVDTAASLIGVSPRTEIKNQTRIRRFTVEYGRALATIHYIKPYLDKFKRMAILLQTLFKHHTHIPKQTFDQVITTLFGKYLTSKQANNIILQMTNEQFNNFLITAENLTEKYLK